MAANLDVNKYGQLLLYTLPSVIETEAENERVLAFIESLLRKGDNLSPEEERLLNLLSLLVEQFEEKAYQFDDSPPHRVLQFLMEQHNLKQSDLVPLLGSRGHVSDIVNGKRGISKNHAKALAGFFHTSAELFL